MTTASLKVGTARSGRSIFTYATEDRSHIETIIKDCILADHFDAWTIFQRLAAREKRRNGIISKHYGEYELFMNLHRMCLTDAFIDEEKMRLSLATSPDLVRFAAQMTEHIFLD